MAILTRIVAAAALVSLALTPVASASAAEVYGLAQQRARSVHHQRAAHINANTGGELKKRGAIAKRCAASSTSLSSSHTTTSQKTSTTPDATTTKYTSTKTSTSKAVATTKASSGSGKKGIAFSGTQDQLDQYLVNNNIMFIYNWGATPIQPKGILSCSMLWGTKTLSAFRSNRDNYDCLMGPNEFNLAAQSGLSVNEVYTYWKDEILPYGAGKTLIAPSVTTADSGLTDMQELLKLCGGSCGWHAVSVHFYGKSAADLISWVTNFRAGLNYPDVWITEWACQSFVEVSGGENCSSDEVWAMMEAVTAWAEATSWVTGYAPYGFAENLGNVAEVNALMDTSGDITDLGRWFINNP